MRRRTIPLGARVSTFGYPFPESPSETNPNLVVNGRYLEGYVVRRFHRDEATRTPCYELDLPAAAGVSGAPLLRINSRELVGIVTGARQLPREEFARVDPVTGQRTPGVQRVQTFAAIQGT